MVYHDLSTAADYDTDSDMSLGGILGITALMCVGIALLLWLLFPSIGQYSFISVLAHSVSIGLTAALLTTTVTRRLGNRRRTSAIWLIGLLIPVSTIAFFGGSTLAKLLLGVPPKTFSVFENTGDTVSLITTVIATAVCAGFFMSRNHINRLKLQASQDGHRAQTAKLAMLQAQVEPHMLFNTLANMRALIRVDPERAVTMLDQLDAYLRLTLEGSRNSNNKLSREFAGIESYLAIMQTRLGDRLRYSLELPDGLAGIEVPSLLIQPVVENAILHGIEPAIEGGQVSVSARSEPGVLLLEIIDTGVGIRGALQMPSTRVSGGFGLHSIRERLPDVDGQSAVCVDSPLPGRASGTKVSLRVKL